MAEPEKFQHYQVQRRPDGRLFELGRGAMGVTFKAYDTNLRVDVALKVISSALLGSEVSRQRFLREARAAAALRHANVASVYHLGNDGDCCFYAMEYVDGETVDARLRREGPLPVRTALEIALQVTRALVAAEKQKLVHRDIKPANIMLQKEDEGEIVVKVIDFGLAKAVEQEGAGDATLTQGGFLGTPHFASPEQLEEKEVDARSDIYSLGVTLWCMLTGKAPFLGSVAQVMSKHLYKPVPLDQLAPLPAAVVNLLKHMLEKQPAERPQTAAELRREIEAVLLSLPAGDFIPAYVQSATSDEPDPMATLVDEPGSATASKLPPSITQVSTKPAAPAPTIPQSVRPEASRKTSLLPVAFGVAALALLGGGGAYWWFNYRGANTTGEVTTALTPKTTTKSAEPAASTTTAHAPEEPAPKLPPSVPPPATPKQVSTSPTPELAVPTTPPPKPKPSPYAAGLAEAQRAANSEDWSAAMTTLVALARNFPEEQEPRRRIEGICARFIRDEKPADREAFEKIHVALEDAAALGITSGIVLLAENLRTTDAVRALDLYEKAALAGDIIAMRQGGLLYSNRKEPGDMARAITWFERGAEKGDAACAYLSGESYLLGKGVAPDPVKGLDYLNQAAEKEYPRALDRLGDYYYKEKKDYAKALSYFEKARRLDWAPSFGNLGVLYMNGTGVTSDPAAAAALFRLGAEKGDPSSMFYFSQCLEGGFGLDKDPVEAQKWLEQAARKGDARAAGKLKTP